MDGSVCLVELQCGQKPVESIVDVSSGGIAVQAGGRG